VDTFYEAFDIKPGDSLYIAPENRVRIWWSFKIIF
jgi:putative endopeptidase